MNRNDGTVNDVVGSVIVSQSHTSRTLGRVSIVPIMKYCLLGSSTERAFMPRHFDLHMRISISYSFIEGL